MKSFVSGGIGGACLVLVGHPFDLVKVRLQMDPNASGAWVLTRSIFATQGIKGFYRGMSMPLVGVSPVFALCFWSYDLGQRLVRAIQGTDGPLGLGAVSFAGGFSALPTALLMTPTEKLKIMLQTQDAKSPIQIVQSIVTRKGIRGLSTLYQGTLATIARDVPGSVAYFGTYEGLKRLFTRDEQTPILAVLFAGGLAGMANWTVSIPADVIKTRVQAGTGQSGFQILTHLLRAEGMSSLFKGLGPSLLRAFPANAACFAGVELSSRLLSFL